VRRQAAEFLELEWVSAQLQSWRTAMQSSLPPALDGPAGALLLWEVLRRLLGEGVPITDVDSIVRGFRAAEPNPADVQPVVERIRLAVASQLPGTHGQQAIVDLPRGFEVALARHVRQAGGRTFLALPPPSARKQREVLLALLADHEAGTAVLRVRNRSLRPFVRRFAERFLPGVPVLSAAELDRSRGAGDGVTWTG